jgi:hypothetical protein
VLDQLLSFFVPTMKLEKSARKAAAGCASLEKRRRRWNRVLQSDAIREQKKNELRTLRAQLNPFALRREVEQILRHAARCINRNLVWAGFFDVIPI